MITNLIYFAWIKQGLGIASETIDLPQTVTNGDELMDYLADRGESYAKIFNNRAAIKLAIDQHYATPDQPIAGAKEIAFFPPVTGG